MRNYPVPLTIERIRSFPTTLRAERVLDASADLREIGDVHESLLRGYQILERVKWLLQEGCSPAVVLQEIAEMEMTS